MSKEENDLVHLSEAQAKARRSRSLALGLALGLLVMVFYAVTLVKGVGGFINRPL